MSLSSVVEPPAVRLISLLSLSLNSSVKETWGTGTSWNGGGLRECLPICSAHFLTPTCEHSASNRAMKPRAHADSILSAADDSTLIDLFEEIVLPDDLDLDFADSTGVGGEGH